VTATLADYETLARNLAARPQELAAITERLERHRATAPLFDTARFTRHLETAYARMWEMWRARIEPRSFAVSSDAPS
jgi:predicted O-linked N-acetylglucosamine transferase (SPINDLY family)